MHEENSVLNWTVDDSRSATDWNKKTTNYILVFIEPFSFKHYVQGRFPSYSKESKHIKMSPYHISRDITEGTVCNERKKL